MKQILIYGLSGPSKAYAVLSYYCVFEDDISINTILRQASIMEMRNPDIKHIYAVDNRYGLKREFQESMKQNSIESHVIFKDTLEREGLKIK